MQGYFSFYGQERCCQQIAETGQQTALFLGSYAFRTVIQMKLIFK